MTLRKVKAAKSLTDKELVDICKDEFGECEIQNGPSATLTSNRTPSNTLAVIINIAANKGSLKVYKDSDNQLGIDFIDKVSPEDCENGDKLVILSWDESWWYRSLGDTRIRYVVAKKS